MSIPQVPSWKFLNTILSGVGRKALAADLNVSRSLIDQYCNEPFGSSNPQGKRNPLDEAGIIIDLMKESEFPDRAHDVGRWVSNRAGGFHTPYPEPVNMPGAGFCEVMDGLLRETADVIQRMREHWFDANSPEHFTAAEKRDVAKEIDEAMAALARARLFVEGGGV